MTAPTPTVTPGVQPGLDILADLDSSPGAHPRDLTHAQRARLRAFFEDKDSGLFFFAKRIFGYRDLIASLHLPIAEFLGRWGESILDTGEIITRPPGEGDNVVKSYRRLMVCIPRECFKTSLCTRAGALWTLARDPTHNATIGIFNEKAENAESWVAAICEVVESSHMFQMLWPEMLPTGISFWDKEARKTLPRRWKWGGTGCRFVRDAIGISELSIEPHGIGGAATGKHFTHKILDDIIGEKAANSPALMLDAIEWVDHSRPLERPAENGCELVVHTPWAYADVYCWSGESRVWMSDGSWKPISEVRPGDEVVGFRKADRETPEDLVGKRGGAQSRTELCVTKVLANGSRPGALVTHLLDDGTAFRCTEDHKFYKIWKSGRKGSEYNSEEGLTDHNYSEVKNLTRLRKVMDAFGPCPAPQTAGWLGGMYDADGTYSRNRIAIYQSEKHYPEICERIRGSFDTLGIPYREYTSKQETNLRGKASVSELKVFCVSDRASRAKFLDWCKPLKHRDKIRASLLAQKPFQVVRITGRSEPELSQVYWIETGTSNYICEGLASKNSHAIKRWPDEYRTYKRHLLENEKGEPDILEGKSIFPQKLTTAKAHQMHKANSFVFWSQYMCIPKAGRELSFPEDWLRFGKIVYSGSEPIFRITDEYYDPEIYDIDIETGEPPPKFIPLSWMSKALLLDPIPGKPTELKREPDCMHGVAIVGKCPWGRRFLLESARYKTPPVELFHELMRLCQKWHCDLMGIEEVNFSYVFQPLFAQLGRDYEFTPTIIPTEPKGRQKDERIRQNLQSPHENGFWYYNIQGTSEAVQEVTEFPFCQFKDVMDAQSYTDEVVFRPETPQEHTRSYYESRTQDRGLCGYGF